MGRTSQRTDRVVCTIKRQQCGPPIDAGLQVDRTGPETVQMTERVLGVVDPKVDPEVFVLHVELGAIAVIRVLHPDDRLTEVGQVEQKSLLDFLKLTAFDFVDLGLIVVPVAKELVSAAKVHGQERVYKCYVVMDAPHFINLLPSQAQFLVPLSPCVEIIAFIPFWAK